MAGIGSGAAIVYLTKEYIAEKKEQVAARKEGGAAEGAEAKDDMAKKDE